MTSLAVTCRFVVPEFIEKLSDNEGENTSEQSLFTGETLALVE